MSNPVSVAQTFPFYFHLAVLSPYRLVALSLGVIASAFAEAETSASMPTASPTMPPDLAALLAPISRWSVSSRVDVSYGYKDNLLLSSANEERSAFARGSAEVVTLWLPDRPFDYSLLAEVAGTRYFTGQSTKHDGRAYVFSELGWTPLKPLRLSLPVIGYYKDEVIDQSDEVVRALSAIKVAGANIGPTLRWTFHPAWWVEGQAAGERKRFDEGFNNFDIGEGALRLGWKPSKRLKVRLGAEQRWRNYAERSQISAAGRELSGTELRIDEREAEALVDLTWDRAGHWQTSTRVTLRSLRDNGSGYFNYGDSGVAHEVEWNDGRWLVRLSGTAQRTEYHVQTVGFGVEPPPLIEDEYSAKLRVEREVTKRWTIFGQFAWERNRSNDPLSSYRVNEGLLGLRWNWEK